MTKKCFIIAGEASGDLQASKLMKAMKQVDSNLLFYGIGGDKMLAEDLHLIKHLRELSFIGFVEVIQHLPEIFKNFKRVKSKLIEQNPDFIILIDFPGFNLKIAKIAHALKIPVIYYITPQLWAWHESRVKQMKTYVDLIINVFPFENEFYAKHHIKSYYFGHPLTEGLAPQYETRSEFYRHFNISESSRILSVLPGSRPSEIQNLLETMLIAASKWANSHPDTVILLSKVPHLSPDLYRISIGVKNLLVIDNYPYDLMKYSDLLIIASGTATLEAACFKTPMIVCYKVNPLTYMIAKQLVKISFISLVNIIAGKKIVPELIQKTCTVENILSEINTIYSKRQEMVEELSIVSDKLQMRNVSSEVAKFILDFVDKKSD